METTDYLAVFWGIYMIVWSVLLLFKPDLKYKIIDFAKNGEQLKKLAWVIVVLGGIHIFYHNIWVGTSHQIMITLFGWIMLVKGLFILLAKYPAWIAEEVLDGGYFIPLLLLLILLGIYLLDNVYHFIAMF